VEELLGEDDVEMLDWLDGSVPDAELEEMEELIMAVEDDEAVELDEDDVEVVEGLVAK